MILVMGLKKTGQSITDYLNKSGRPFCVYDKNEEILVKYKIMGIKTYTGNDIIDDDDIDLVIKSPGIPPMEEHVLYFKRKGIKVVSDIEFFYNEITPENIIAVTGTNGKTTTTEMLGKLLEDKEPIVAGNIGIPIISYDRKPDDIYIFELSSFQLDDIYTFRPKVSILLNVEEDHIDWHGNFENYKKAKYKIFKNQTKSDALIIDADHIVESELNTSAKIYKYSSIKKDGMNAYLEDGYLKINRDEFKMDIPLENIKYRERHNIGNLCAALLAGSFFDINESVVNRFLEEFKLDYHRVENLGMVNGIKFIDDSKATNPAATLSAIIGCDERTILLLGGYDKITDFSDVIALGKRKLKKMIFFGNIKEKLENTAKSIGAENYAVKSNMKEAWDEAIISAKPGDTIILSPGASSFDEFSSYEERGDYFKKLVKELKK